MNKSKGIRKCSHIRYLLHLCNRHAHGHYPTVYATLHHLHGWLLDATGYLKVFLSRTTQFIITRCICINMLMHFRNTITQFVAMLWFVLHCNLRIWELIIKVYYSLWFRKIEQEWRKQFIFLSSKRFNFRKWNNCNFIEVMRHLSQSISIAWFIVHIIQW